MSIVIRELRSGDMPAVLDLIRADVLEGQPVCGAADLQAALDGTVTIEAGWWERFTSIRAVVALEDGAVVGAASYALRALCGPQAVGEGIDAPRYDGAGFVLWLHAMERRAVIEALLRTMLDVLRECPAVYAFWISTPLTCGVEGLPLEHRPVTHRVLAEMGFAGKDDWLYMVGPVAQDAEIEVEEHCRGEGEWQLQVNGERGEQNVAHAVIGLGRERLGILWWITVEENWRGRGLGGRLLRRARKVLGEKGADRVILYVDHDDPEREAAIHLYLTQGFCVLDHLWSYQRAGMAS
jgi:ribosomal protein S18 acetylase RimI-like enzyme